MSERPLCADALRRNALFRVLAFLDSTGVQSFELARDVDAEGRFIDPDTLFAEGTAIHAILAEGLEAFRENIRVHFLNEKERAALLAVTGTGAVAAPSGADTSPAADGREGVSAGEEGPRVSDSETTTPSHPSASPTPLSPETGWSRALRRPRSLHRFADALSGSFTLNLLYRLEEVLGVPAATFTDAALIEQYMIDALDRWMAGRSDTDNAALVLACGVQPAVLATATARQAERPHALTDFVIDVVFPPLDELGEGAAGVVDWLLLTYQHNHESVDVEAEEDDGEGDGEGSLADGEAPRQRARTGDGPVMGREGSHDEGLAGWQPPDDELVLTADNIDRYMRESPSLVPREIIREKRRSWLAPGISAFELEQHYTAAELKAAVRELAGLARVDQAAFAAWEGAAARAHGYVVGSATAPVREAAARAMRKSDCVAVILRLHGGGGSSGGAGGAGRAEGEGVRDGLCA